ncbi:hypothetical protein NIES2111_31860 [Nostoc sp. NIES-2111]|nr:hypothetical protein NIES2111_31860 [Nostoc sp. NIES-2111]
MTINNKSINLVIGIDFGTSRSGYAYAFTDDTKIYGKTDWSGAPAPYPKTQSHLLYSPDGEVIAWGFDARKKLAELQKDADKYMFFQNFKMQLRESRQNNANGFVITTKNRKNIVVIDLIADYLRLLKDLALKEIKEIKILNYICSDLQRVLIWLETLKSGNKPNYQDIDKVVILISGKNKLLSLYSSLLQEQINFQDKISLLKQDITNFQQKNSQQTQYISFIEDEKRKLTIENNNLRQNNQRLSNERNYYARQIQTNTQQQYLLQLQDEIRQINKKYNDLEKDIKHLENERNELVIEKGQILGKLAAKQIDKTTTFVTYTSSDDNIQHHILYQEFKQLKDQEFNAFSNKLFHYRCEQSLALKSNRKREITIIKSVLSENILINGMKIFAENSDFSPEILENAMKVVRPSFCHALGIVENSEISKILSNELENLIKQGIKFVTKTSSNDTTKRSWNEEEFTEAVKDISRTVYTALQIAEETNISREIRTNTDNLVRKGLELVKKIASADPPGNLWIEQKDTLFDYEKHEAVLGCKEGGKILLTVYPGYVVGNRIFEKALVFTEQEE